MKLKEKISDKLNNNETFSLIKELWGNKRYRSLFWLGLYFIFFFVIIVSSRSNYSEPLDSQTPENNPNIDIVLAVEEYMNDLDEYDYEISLNKDDILITGNVKNDTNTFTFNKKNYVIVADSIYLENGTNLIKTDLTKNSEIIIPINKITINQIKNYIRNIESTDIIKQDSIYTVKYNLPLSNVLDSEEGNFNLSINYSTKLESIEIDLTDYIISKNMKYDNYILTIKILDNKDEGSE